MSPTVRDQLQSALGDAYTLDRELGGGGMAYVFTADDRALGRRVVVKVLRPELAEGLSAARFKREIQLAARLQHPHIVPLLAAGELASGVLYYSMPYVEGESLRGRLDSAGSLPIGDAVAMLRDVVSALAYAHRQRVVHRDIKPENILLADGGAVVTDFGIAKAISAAIASEPQPSTDGRRASTLTAAGLSLGTPAYMAPEQGAADVVDHRADLYSLGVVAYEILAGSLPFEGRNSQQLLAAHATQLPEPLVRRRASVPIPLAALVMQLLEKQPADRPQSADEVLRRLDEAALETTPRPLRVASVAVRTRFRDPLVLGLAAAVALLLGVLALAVRAAGWREPAPRPLVVSLVPPDGTTLRPGNGFALSPDGTRLAFVADKRGAVGIWIRALDARSANFVPGTESGTGPFWAPDGASLGFFAGGQLKVVGLPGGTPRVLCAAPRPGGGAWTKDGTIVFAPNVLGVPLSRVAATGGPCTELTRIRPGDVDHRRPVALPDGRHLLFSSFRSKAALVVDVATGAITEVRKPAGDAQFAPPNWLLYRDEERGIIYAQRLDLRTLRSIGESYVVLDSAPYGILAYPGYSVRERTLVVPHGFGGGRMLAWIDQRSAVVDSFAVPFGVGALFGNLAASLSHDGRSVAMGGPGLWLYDRARAVATRAVLDDSDATYVGAPSWSPGDSLIAFTTVLGAPGALRLYHVATGASDSLFAAGRRQAMMPDWSPDGRRIAFQLQAGDGAARAEIWIWSRDDRTAHRAWPAAGNQGAPRWSPDGNWLAYESDESGQYEVYVRPANGVGVGVRVSSAGGDRPRWRRTRGGLYYRAPDGAVMVADVQLIPTLALSPPRLIVSGAPFNRNSRGFEVSADGDRFLGFARSDPTVFTLMLDWAARLPAP